MSRPTLCAGSLAGTLLMCISTANAQWVSNNPCACYAPVARPCYRTVPVTEYREVRQTVQKPIYETKYVTQNVTAYKPVTETRTASVPTVRYHNVTQCRTVYRNCGYWRTRYECRNLPSPCQYDPRPDLFGWLNRTAYSIRATFTPRVIARREYVPRVVAEQIPYTRTVAHHGTRQVSYQVTRMVPYTTTRKVAVNTVRYVTQQVVTRRPVTVWRTVPIGTTIAYAPITNTRTVLQPTPDPVSRRRSADSTDSKFNDKSRGASDQKFKRDSDKLNNLGTSRSTQPTIDPNSRKLGRLRDRTNAAPAAFDRADQPLGRQPPPESAEQNAGPGLEHQRLGRRSLGRGSDDNQFALAAPVSRRCPIFLRGERTPDHTRATADSSVSSSMMNDLTGAFFT